MEKVVFTAITGGRDQLKEGQNTENASFVAFLEVPQSSETWEIRKADMDNPDPNRCAKKYKVLPHRYFPDAEYSLWIDGSVTLLDPMDKLIDLYLKDTDIALHKHYMRDCVYEEAMVCGMERLDDPDVISRQMARYWVKERYPRNNGMAECTVILRRHTPRIESLNELWWNQIQQGSRRDQLSFPYCLWKLDIKYTQMEGTIYKSPHFKLEKHAK